MPSIDEILALAKQDGGPLKLSLSFGTKSVGGGEYIPKRDAQKPPQLTIQGDEQGPFVAVGLDIDAPYPSFPLLSSILHLVQHNLTRGADGTLTHGDTAPVADWISPAPPPFSAVHRYIMVLFKQPPDFAAAWGSGKKLSIAQRTRVNVDKFVADAKLGEPVAAQFFTSG